MLLTSCSKKSQLTQISSECENHYSEISDWFYFDQESNLVHILENKEKSNAIKFLRKISPCLNQSSSDQIAKFFDTEWEQVFNDDSSKQLIIYPFEKKSNPEYNQLRDPPIYIVVKGDTGMNEVVIEQAMPSSHSSIPSYKFIFWK